VAPPWLGDGRMHARHRPTLVRKDRRSTDRSSPRQTPPWRPCPLGRAPRGAMWVDLAAARAGERPDLVVARPTLAPHLAACGVALAFAGNRRRVGVDPARSGARGCARQRAGRQRRRARGTNGEWQIRHDRRWLTIAVRDGNSAAPARLHEGAVHGLDVVDEPSVGWRCDLLPEGARSSGCARDHARATDRSAAGGGTAIGRRRRSRP
jgi:hypothetical protein